MASEGWKPVSDLIRSMLREPYRFDFFQAVRILKSFMGQAKGVRVPVETDDVVRFGTLPSLEFPASALHSLESPPKGGQDALDPFRMTVTFMGLVGLKGVLPRHYTEALLEPNSSKVRQQARAFFDIFNHKFISLFYDAWEKHSFVVSHERKAETALNRYVLDVIGLGTNGLQGRLKDNSHGVEDSSLCYYGGLLGQLPRSASALTAVLSDFFSVNIDVEQFRLRAYEIRESDQTRLGLENCRLGLDAVVGEAVWDRQFAFRLVVGPLSWPKFQDFLPGGNANTALHQLVRYSIGMNMEYDIQLILNKEEVPYCKLSGATGKLGLTTWLKSGPFMQDADSAVF